MSKEYIEALLDLKEKQYRGYLSDDEYVEKINKILDDYVIDYNRSSDNANPSEALECLENIWCDISTNYTNEYVTIKSALLKAQEPKHYLKWEDLDFSFKDKYMKVKLNGNIYTLRYTRNALAKFPVAYLEFNNTEIMIVDCKKQFFNDLHLERVEE